MRHYKRRNRYCLNSKLSEQAFLALLKLYALGRTATYAADAVSRWSRLQGEKGITRVTAQKHFQAFGERVLDDFVFSKFDAEQRRSYERYVFPQILRIYWGFTHGTHDYQRERNFPFKAGTVTTYLDQTPFALEALPILKDRLRKMRGFRKTRETFRAHFAYATLLYFGRDGEELIRRLLPARNMRGVQLRSFTNFVTRLEQKPLSLNAEMIQP